jgi:hypothetical protein
MARVELYNLGQKGIIADQKEWLLEPEVWTSGKNVRFNENGVMLISGHASVFGSFQATPEFLFALQTTEKTFWFYASLTEIWVIDTGTHAEVTRASGDYTASLGREWNGTILGGIPILNNGIDIPQYWTGTTSADKFADMSNWPSTLRAKVLRAFGPYLVALNLTDNAVALPQAIQWSHKADPGSLPSSWDYTDPTVDAGRTFLTDTEGGDISDGVLLGDRLVIYKDNSTHTLRFVGGVDIFSPQLILATSGILAARCACAFKFGTRHAVLTQDDVIIHQGTTEAESIADMRIRRHIFSNIDVVNFRNSHVFENPNANEVWVVYPENGATYPTIAAIWNYKFDTWTFRDFTGVSVAQGATADSEFGVWDDEAVTWDSVDRPWGREERRQLAFVNRSAGYVLDSGNTFAESLILGSLERRGIAIDGKSRDGKPKASISTKKIWYRLWPKISGGPVTIEIGVQEKADNSVDPVWISNQFFTPGQDEYLDFEANGRLLAIRITSATQEQWILSGYDLEVEPLSGM